MATQDITTQTTSAGQSTISNSIGSVRDLASAGTGAALAVAGLARRGLVGWVLGMVGGSMLVRSARRMPIVTQFAQEARQKLTGRQDRALIREGGQVKDVVQEASEESFPASDSPGYW